MQRRHFITMAAVGAAGLAWPSTGRLVARTPVHAVPAPRLLAMFGDESVARHLGLGYRHLVPAENDARVLAEAILPEPHRARPDALEEWLAGQVRRDFDAGRTVTVHGWILAVTEARQCALYSLQFT